MDHWAVVNVTTTMYTNHCKHCFDNTTTNIALCVHVPAVTCEVVVTDGAVRYCQFQSGQDERILITAVQ